MSVPGPTAAAANVKMLAPLLAVASMEKSRSFYVDGLGFVMTRSWIDDGVLRWCWLDLGGASVMLQELRKQGHGSWVPQGKVGEGVAICLYCQDALAIYRETRARGLAPSRPFVGNGMWVTSLSDPDGYRLEFHSVTDVPEETQLPEEAA
jgi:lactoylglutathione lyase